MSHNLTPTQTLLVWCLLAKQGVAKQADIVPAVKAADRKALEALKFVTVETRSRSLWITLEDKGWGWANNHLRDPLPPAFRALQDFFDRLHVYLTKSEEKLAGFIGVPEQTLPLPMARSAVTLRKIKTAYARATNKRTSVRVLLTDLRDNLLKENRADVDEALCAAHLNGKIKLMRLDNPAEVTPAVKDAQIEFKGEPLHLIWIEK